MIEKVYFTIPEITKRTSIREVDIIRISDELSVGFKRNAKGVRLYNLGAVRKIEERAKELMDGAVEILPFKRILKPKVKTVNRDFIKHAKRIANFTTLLLTETDQGKKRLYKAGIRKELLAAVENPTAE